MLAVEQVEKAFVSEVFELKLKLVKTIIARIQNI